MNADCIEKEIHNGRIGRPVIYHEVTGSTNSDVKLLAENGSAHGTLVVSSRQESGRGRLGRKWVTRGEDAIAMSLLLRPSFDKSQASKLTLLAGLSTTQAVSELTGAGDRVKIKWPNDVVIDGKKICGILTELCLTPGSDAYYVIIGIGINVMTADFPEEIQSVAGSILTQTGISVPRERLIGEVIDRFQELYEIYEKRTSLEEHIELYHQYLAGLNQGVRVLDPKGEYEGICLGINKEGELMVRRADGSIANVYAGEVSVRGLYGYV